MMARGGDEFYWKVEFPLLIFSKTRNSSITSEEFVCYRENGSNLENSTIWTITLQATETDKLYLGVWLSNNISYNNCLESIERCLPRYQLSLLTPTGLDIAFMNDIWIPVLDMAEVRGNAELISHNRLIEVLQCCDDNYIVFRLQLQYRNSLGKFFPLSPSGLLNFNVIVYILLKKPHKINIAYLSKSNRLLTLYKNNGESYTFNFDKYIGKKILNECIKYCNANQIGPDLVNKHLLYFLEAPCESRLSVNDVPILIYFLNLFHSIDIFIFADMAASVIISKLNNNLKDIIELYDKLKPEFLAFEIVFWSYLYNFVNLEDYSEEEAIVIQKHLLNYNNKIGRNKQDFINTILTEFNRAIKYALIVNLDSAITTGKITKQERKIIGTAAQAA